MSKYKLYCPEHYGIRCSDNRTLYKREWKYFKKHGVCRWLNEQ